MRKVPITAKKIHNLLLLIEDGRLTGAEMASLCNSLLTSVREHLASQYGLKARNERPGRGKGKIQL